MAVDAIKKWLCLNAPAVSGVISLLLCTTHRVFAVSRLIVSEESEKVERCDVHLTPYEY